MTEKRSYDNSLRQKRAAQTRDKIMKALSQLIAENSMDDLSVPRLAKLAGVSEPTVYRNFPNRDALLDALDEQMRKDFKRPPGPKTLDGLPDHIEQLFVRFDEERDLIVSFFKSAASRETRKGLRRRRLQVLRKMVDEELPALCEEERLQIFAIIQLLASGDAWWSMNDFVGLSAEHSGPAASWALRALLADAKRRNSRAEKKADK